MVGYVTLGTNDLPRAARFYDALANRIHQLAPSLGGKDEGAPGPRGEGFYAGYFRDPDGNKLNAFVMG